MTTLSTVPNQTYTLEAASADSFTARRLGFGAMRITGPGIWGTLLIEVPLSRF